MNNLVNNNDFICIRGYMVNDLKLKGNDLLIYAIINSYTESDNGKYDGGLQYLANWVNSTKQNISKNLKTLIEKGLIVKSEESIEGKKVIEYRTPQNNKCTLQDNERTSQNNESTLKEYANIIYNIYNYLNIKINKYYTNTKYYNYKEVLNNSTIMNHSTMKYNSTNINKEKENKILHILLKEKEINSNNKKCAYGEFQNVLLTDEEYFKLKNKFSDVDSKIEALSLYIASKGGKYKNHYATILAWDRKEKKNKPDEMSFYREA